MNIDIDRQAAIDLVAKLMAIPGTSGQEEAVAEEIRKVLRKLPLSDATIEFDSANTRSPIGGQIGNLIVKVPGTVRGPRRLLMAHIDTVPLCVGSKPVLETIDGREVFRSAEPGTALGGDDRSGASVILTAISELKRQKIDHPPLTLMWAVQEEIGLRGARHLTKGKLNQPKLCFNFDGGSPTGVTIGATGDVAMTITIHGRASHAGVAPEAGVSAAVIASRAIADLEADGWHGLIEKGRKSGTSNVGIVSGGDATNVVLPKLVISAEARSHDMKFRQRIVDAFKKAFEKAAKSTKNVSGDAGSIEFESDLKYESFKLNRTDPVVKTVSEVIKSLGLKPDLRISNGGLDANWMTEHGFPTVTIGCGQSDIHTVDETLDVEDYLTACRIATHLAAGA